MAATLVAGSALGGGMDSVGKIGSEAIETAGEVLRDLIKQVPVPPQASIPAMTIPTATPEGTRQLRLILRQRTREARINAKAQMISTLLASPVSMIVIALGSAVAARASLQTIAKNTAMPAEVRAAAEAMLAEIPAAKLPSITDLGATIPAALPAVAPAATGIQMATDVARNPLGAFTASAEGAFMLGSPAYAAYRLLGR